MTSRSNSVLLACLMLACTPEAEAPAKADLPPPEAVKAAGKAMVTTHGYIHPDDPPGTWRARRPHGKLIRPCSDWIPNGPPITDAFGKTVSGPTSIHMSWTIQPRPGFDTLSASTLTSVFGPPHPATTSVMIGFAAPLGPHWTWTLKDEPGPTLIAEEMPDGRVRFHSADIGRIGGGNGMRLMIECLVERYGTPGW